MSAKHAARLALIVWWFALVDTKGEVALFEYDKRESCENVRRAYLYSVPKERLTPCREVVSSAKEQSRERKQGI